MQPIPPHAKCVFKGALFDVYQWQQELFDGTVATFEKLKRRDTVVVFPVHSDGKILITEQKQPGRSESFLCGAGGTVEDGEDILSAAKRELLEETGFEAKEFTLWDVQQPASKIEWAVYTLVAKGIRKTSEPNLDAGEKIKLLPVSLDEFIEVATGGKENFVEKEIVPILFKAKLDPEKRKELEELFRP
jgi:ADP-ribose pyrophosphatase